MKKYTARNPGPIPPPLRDEEEGSANDVETLLKSIDGQFEKANALKNSLVEINQNFNTIVQEINELLIRANVICEKAKTIDIQVNLSEQSKNELDLFHKNYKDRLEQQLAAHAKQLDEVLNDYEIKQATMLKASLKMFDSKNKKGVWLSDKTFWILVLLFDILLSATTWFVGHALTI